ncbi:aminotransferase class V-fold PLP-dependent enzyme [Jiulongibacter sediminis]|nr:aminotransferase class V-fold PLP-dependent enzyme [Jiulongibacter sediminis]
MMFENFFTFRTQRHRVSFEIIRKRDFPQLDRQAHTYLDYTGGGLYAIPQIEKHQKLLRESVFGNPHSINPTSSLSTALVEETREKVLSFFNATDEYDCIFTANASGALKIVGECFPFDEKSAFVLSKDNHNSVLGIKEKAQKKGAKVNFLELTPDLQIDKSDFLKALEEVDHYDTKLLAYPAQSNYSGVKHSLQMVREAKEKGFYVLLDAAAFTPSNLLDLKDVPADFVCISFYKMFGYPTGIGCLLVRKETCCKLQKDYFAGGTVKVASTYDQTYALHQNHEKFEDGTINYNQIPALKIGLEYLESIGMPRIQLQIQKNSRQFTGALSDIRHQNGSPLIKIIGPSDMEVRGNTIAFHILDSLGQRIDLEQIEQDALRFNISLRTGCFCNPGADECYHQLKRPEVKELLDAIEINNVTKIQQLKRKRGAVRISVGMITNEKDLMTLLNFLNNYLLADARNAA